MAGVAIAVFLWLLVAVLLIFRRNRVRSITYAVMAIAVSVTLNIDPVYVWFDGLIGGRNVGDLLANWSFIAGAFFLARGVSQAYEFTNRAVRILLGPITHIAALAAMTIAFIFIDAPVTSTRFMADFGGQPAAAAYSIIQYTYLGGTMVGMLRVSWEQARTARGFLKVSTWTLTVGAAIAVLLSVTIIGMDLANLLNEDALLQVLQSVYDVLRPLTFLVIGLGLAGPPIQRWNRRVVHQRGTKQHLNALTEMWMRSGGDATKLRGLSPDARLQRMIVEIRDARVRSGVDLDADEAAVRDAEQHLAQPPAVRPATSPQRNHPQRVQAA